MANPIPPTLPRATGLRCPAILLLLPLLLLGACGSGPRPTAFDDRPLVPVELRQLANGRAGELELDTVDPEPASRIRLARPFRSADQGDGWRNYTFDAPSPVARVRQFLPPSDASRTVGTIAVLRPADAATSARRLQELVEAGLAPTTTAGLGGLRGAADEVPALITHTDDPRMLLAFRDGHVAAVLRELEPGAVTGRLPSFVAADAIATDSRTASAAWLRGVLTALQQDAPLAADREALAEAPRARLLALDTESWASLADEAAAWDARFTTADLAGRLARAVDQAILLKRAFPDDVPLSGRAATWRSDTWKALHDDLDAALSTGIDREETTSSELLQQLDAFGDRRFDHLIRDEGRPAWWAFTGRVGWERARLAVIDPAAPFTSTRDELDHLLRSLDGTGERVFVPDSRLLERCTRQAARRLRRFADEPRRSETDRAWARALAEDLDAAATDRILDVRNDAATACDLLGHLATRIAGADQELATWAALGAGLSAMARGDDRPPAVRAEAQRALGPLATRARALSGVTSRAADRAALRAFTNGLQLPPLAAFHTLAHAVELLDGARALDLDSTRPVVDRIADLETFANRQARFGPLAAMVAAELALPLGRELATRAAQLSEAGSHARAAELLLTAASIGSAEGPAPKDSIELRREAAALREQAGQDAVDAPAQRTWWLHRAQAEVLLAVTPLLPPVAADDPLFALHTRYVARQLAGHAHWPSRYGLRLAGQQDVLRAASGTARVRLGRVEEQPRWVPLDSEAPSPDPDELGADPADWEAIADLARSVAEARDALRTAQAGRDLSRPELEDRDRGLLDKIRELELSIDRGQVDPLTARTRIDRLQREANALRDLLANFNDRSHHIEARTNDYNDRVRTYNARLDQALGGLGLCFREALGPATDAWIRTRLGELGLDAEESRLRAALCGLDDFTEPPVQRPAHPVAVAARLRDATGATTAAQVLADELERRIADVTYNQGIPPSEHVERLAPAFRLFARDYGAEAFARALLRGALGNHADLHGACVGTLDEAELRDAVERQG